MSKGKGTVNKVILVGRLGGDPQLRYTTSGMASASFSLATNAVWKDQTGEKQEKTDWHNIKMWDKLAEVAGQWLKKGSLVYLEGRMQTRSYDKDNVKMYITEVVVNDMVMLGGKQAAGQAEQIPQQESGQDPYLPF